MNLAIGFIQLSIAAILLHRVMPAKLAHDHMCSARVWFFSVGLSCNGAISMIEYLGHKGGNEVLSITGGLSFAVAGLLWIFKTKGSWLNVR